VKVVLKSAGLLLAVFIAGCAPGPLKVVSTGTGSDLASKGKISDPGLVFTFPAYTGGGKVQDLFNYLYFRGDTVCFSFRLNRQVPVNSVRVMFIDPRTGRSFPAERTDVRGRYICGFSLVGTILEQFNAGELDRPVPPDAFCCRDMAFSVSLLVHTEEGRLEHSSSGAFRLKYSDISTQKGAGPF